MATGYHYLNGKFIEKDQCFLHVTDLSIQRSYAVFDYLTYQHKKPLYIDDYLKRFVKSVATMGLEFPHSLEETKETISTLIELNEVDKGGIKLIYTGGYAPNGYDAAEPNFLIMQLDFPIIPQHHYQNGIKLLLEEYIRDFPQAKSTDYFFSLSIKEKLKEENAFDVLYFKDGLISESSRSNFFLVDDQGNICTPDKAILEGITRKKLMELDQNIVVRDILVDEIATAQEAFLTSSVKRVLPVTSIGNQIIGRGKPGEKTLGLYKKLIAADKEYMAKN